MYSISIIIPCYNEVKNIELFLLSFKKLKLTEKYNLEFLLMMEAMMKHGKLLKIVKINSNLISKVRKNFLIKVRILPFYQV